MCDPAGARGRGWRGWRPIPEPVAGIPDGPWLDLSHRLNAAMPRVPTFPPPVVRKRMCMPADPLNVTEFSMVVHTGTHIDAPRHFFDDGPALSPSRPGHHPAAHRFPLVAQASHAALITRMPYQ